MGVLEHGQWQASKSADQLSHEDSFSGEIKPEPGRYHLYVSKACPFAHRPWLVIRLLGLDDAITVSSVAAVRHDQGWEFSQNSPDPILNSRYLTDVYTRSAPQFTGRVSVPVLWDKVENKIVCNDSARLATELATNWTRLATQSHTLLPEHLTEDIADLNLWLHKNINRRVYQAGFATSQEVYDQEVSVFFDAMDTLEKRLETAEYLMGSQLTLPDLFLFPTLIRLETVYAVHFRANRKALNDYPALSRYMQAMLSRPALRETIHMRHIMEHYYLSHRHINPFGIIPVGPRPDWIQSYGLMD